MNDNRLILEYINTKMSIYIEAYRVQKLGRDEMKRMYDNIKELCSLCDYCFIGFTINMRQKLDEIEQINKEMVRSIYKK